jgi:hypothetical protein
VTAPEQPEPIVDVVLSPRAQGEMVRRGLDEAIVRRVLTAPEQRLPVRPGRDVLQSRLDMGGKRYLVRVFVDVDRVPAEVVTVYRTSRIDKYWSTEQ